MVAVGLLCNLVEHLEALMVTLGLRVFFLGNGRTGLPLVEVDLEADGFHRQFGHAGFDNGIKQLAGLVCQPQNQLLLLLWRQVEAFQLEDFRGVWHCRKALAAPGARWQRPA